MCLKNYKLDAAHYFSSPGLAWDAMLKMTRVKLELMTDREMHDIVDKGTRGGISVISHKYAKANNHYMPETFDRSQPSSYIMYYDMNNLYGTAMCEPLPQKHFDFLPEDQVDAFDFESVPDDGPTGYLLEVDLEYPEHLHDSHSQYPLAPESLVIQLEDLSPYTRSLGEKLGVTPSSKCKKLIASLRPKYRYALHYRNLKQYVKLGMCVKKIHRIISFSQSRWLKPYIDFNTDQRKLAQSEFEKDFFKLMNNRCVR